MFAQGPSECDFPLSIISCSSTEHHWGSSSVSATSIHSIIYITVTSISIVIIIPFAPVILNSTHSRFIAPLSLVKTSALYQVPILYLWYHPLFLVNCPTEGRRSLRFDLPVNEDYQHFNKSPVWSSWWLWGGVWLIQGLKGVSVFVARILEIIYLWTCCLYTQCKHELNQKLEDNKWSHVMGSLDEFYLLPLLFLIPLTREKPPGFVS